MTPKHMLQRLDLCHNCMHASKTLPTDMRSFAVVGRCRDAPASDELISG